MNDMTIDQRLEEYLVANNLISMTALQASKMEIEVTEGELSESLVRNGFIRQDIIINAMLEITDSNLINEEKIVDHIPVELFKKHRFKIAAETIKNVFISTLGNEDNLREDLVEFFPEQKIIFIPANPDSIDNYIDKIEIIQDSEGSDLEKIIRDAISIGASDIHILQRERTYSVFYRIDGVSRLMREADVKEYLSISARIKDRSNVDMAEKRIPMDGGFDLEHNGRKISLRVATVPLVNDTETIVIRVLDPEKSNIPIGSLGITALEEWRKGSRRLEGLNLICGMTGSGKTTTLSATMRELDRFGKSIYTAEDPVEHKIPFIRQLNINNEVGLDFSRALKAFMRADPDIIILGEVRDDETARNAIKAAETGHLVFATLHTGSILGAVGRLRDLGIPLYQLRTVLRSVLAQQLIRTICPTCKERGHVDKNCPRCSGIGYKGRTIVSECYYFKDEEEVNDIMESRIKKWPSVVEDAFLKVKMGVTDSKEFYRVFGPEAESILEERKDELIELGIEYRTGRVEWRDLK